MMKRGKLGILVGGGPAPGINGVISAATIEGINQGYEVIGFRDGFKWLAAGDKQHYTKLTIDDVKSIHLRGGSILGTARTNPAKSETSMHNVLDVLQKLGVTALVTIGGDDTAFSASNVYRKAEGKIRVAQARRKRRDDRVIALVDLRLVGLDPLQPATGRGVAVDHAHGGHEGLERAVRRRPAELALPGRVGEREDRIGQVGIGDRPRVEGRDAGPARHADPRSVRRAEPLVDPVEHLVDTTGAGDLYAAGFLYGFTQGRSLPDCGRLGSVAAAAVLGHYGARPGLSLAQFVELLD